MDQIINCYLDAWRNWNNFSGRTRRSGFWYVVLANILISLVFGILTALLGFFAVLSGLYSLAFLVPGITLSIRRLHDIGKSGWWLLIYLVPLVGWIVLLVFLCTDSGPDNQWGPNPKGYGGGYGSSCGGCGPAQQPYQNQGYQNQGYQNQGYQNQGYQNQGYQNQGYQAPGPSDPPDHDRYKGPEL